MAHTDGTEVAVVSDVGLPGISLGMALVLIRRYDAELPVVIVSGNIGEAGARFEQPDAAWERRDGSPVHISVTFSPVHSGSVVTGASIIARDITYRRNAGGTGWPCPVPSCSIRALRPGPEPTVRPGDPCS